LPRCCRYCHQSFQPSKFHSRQNACSQPECQRRRRAEYHRRRIDTDPEYAEVVRDSRRKWRERHPAYQKTYRQTHPTSVERNRDLQRQRDAPPGTVSCKEHLGSGSKALHGRSLAGRPSGRRSCKQQLGSVPDVYFSATCARGSRSVGILKRTTLWSGRP
jgi:hypothetical protein